MKNLRLVAYVWLSTAVAGTTQDLTPEERAWLQEPRKHSFSVFEDVRIELGQIDELTSEELFERTEEGMPWPATEIVRELRISALAERDFETAWSLAENSMQQMLRNDLLDRVPLETAIRLYKSHPNRYVARSLETQIIWHLWNAGRFDESWEFFESAPHGVKSRFGDTMFETLTLRSPIRASAEFRQLSSKALRSTAMRGINNGLDQLPPIWMVSVLLDFPADEEKERAGLVESLQDKMEDFEHRGIQNWIKAGCPADAVEQMRQVLVQQLPVPPVPKPVPSLEAGEIHQIDRKSVV